MKLVFWCSFFLSAYVYFIYPLVINIFSIVFNKKFKKEKVSPAISVIITAYNEENDIASKIENTLSIEYPKDKTEIIVGSDGSTDKTNEIVRTYKNQGIKLMAFDENRGKTITQNDCVKAAQNEIIVFMDAASLCHKNALNEVVSNFADPRVGCVAGKIAFITSKDNIVTESQGLYWRYEQFLKRSESRLGSLVGVDGPLYAIRKNLYIPLGSTMISDLLTPLLVIKQGFAVILEPNAVTYEEATKSSKDERKTRRRIVLRGLIGLRRHCELMNPCRYPLLAWQIISHKILRWLVGGFFVCMFFSAAMLVKNIFYFFILLCMILFLILAFIGFINPGNKKNLFVVPYYFTLVNGAALRGVIDFFMGKKIVSWEPVRK